MKNKGISAVNYKTKIKNANATFPKISLVENDVIISDEAKVANSFRNFFENAINSLGIKSKSK